MEVMVGPTFTIAGEHPNADAAIFDDGSGFRKAEFFTADSSESSSSIGTPDNSDNDEDEDDDEEEVQSKFKGLVSLEDSLPFKKGLSSHFIGKSKSFTDLSQVNTVKELEKQENPFNKRKRVLIAAKWSRRSFYSWSNPKSMPILPMVDEDQDDSFYDEEAEDDKGRRKVSPSSSSSSLDGKKQQQEEEQDQVHQMRQLDNNNRVPQSYAAHMRLRLGSFKSRSFSLADLQEHDNEEEEEEDDDEED
ncbi:hypothetical protein TanjilG_15721 [Lupinus angustifolius]|uniref:Uncharacterized protein n=1 Tax=Lupinus angustifolius TaxID=3871 RepID=A0A1J7HNF3_LUPAN|nr:PREDICTED: nucleolin-like [Lupinus angustifolius]OIW14367.1 hypothetical protein TanjilG_15721 [Lupinus angustifolius]